MRLIAQLIVLLPLTAAFHAVSHGHLLASHGRPAVAAVAPCMMAGFGASTPAKPKGKGGKKAKAAKPAAKPSASPRRQWDTFKELVSGGAPRVKVFAQLDEAWTEVGDVSVASPGTATQAALANKRLILEHAPRIKPGLLLRAKELKLGVEGADGPELLKKEDVPADLVSGFEGMPDPSGMYSKVKATSFGSDPTAIIGSDFTNKA
jgi:hypothetical protein